MAVQRSLGWATTKKSIAMTGQAKRKCSMVALQSFDMGSRKNSLIHDSRKNSPIDEMSEVDEDSQKNSVDETNSVAQTETNSLAHETNSAAQSSGESDRKNSLEYSSEDGYAYEELLKYSARKFSIFVNIDSQDERTILDDAEYFMSKKECDYGMCQCCSVEKKLHTNWESIEEIIENDPEIIFDSEDNPIVVDPVHNEPSLMNNNHSDKIIPSVLKTIYEKITETLKEST